MGNFPWLTSYPEKWATWPYIKPEIKTSVLCHLQKSQ